MRCSLLVAQLILVAGVVAVAQSPTYKLGRPPTEDELNPSHLAVRPEDGQGLPPGSGNAELGATTYLARGCGKCHGPTGIEGPAPRLIGTGSPVVQNTLFAPQLWNTINRMMPLDRMEAFTRFKNYTTLTPLVPNLMTSCCLAPNEVYGLVAYVLERNGIIQKGDVMDAKTLPKVQMPNRKEYAPPPYVDSEWKPGMRQRINK